MQAVPIRLKCWRQRVAERAIPRRPFLLQARASYTAIGVFSVASYPYSFKLLWSPIVDSVYSLAFGRRKSWVVRRLARWLVVSADTVQGFPY